jgi:hypothetical protein
MLSLRWPSWGKSELGLRQKTCDDGMNENETNDAQGSKQDDVSNLIRQTVTVLNVHVFQGKTRRQQHMCFLTLNDSNAETLHVATFLSLRVPVTMSGMKNVPRAVFKTTTNRVKCYTLSNCHFFRRN